MPAAALALVVALILLAPPPALALTAAEAGHAEVTVDVPRGGAYPMEMLKLHVHSTIRGFVALENLRQPSLTDLNWKQLGADVWSYDMEKGLRENAFERVMAIYPQRSGRITIDPFEHHLTMVDTDGLRTEVTLATAPFTLTILALPPDAATWWLPAASLTVSDTWDKRPDRLSLGETARRTVQIEAVGVGIEQLPPAPKMRAPGIISFAGPVERTVRLAPDGPVSRVVYRWDVRPVSTDAAILPAVQIPWFDTRARRSRIALIPERRISLAGADQRDEETGQVIRPRSFAWSTFALATAAALGWGTATIWLWRRRGVANQHPALPRLRRAARRGDAKAFKAALMTLPLDAGTAADADLRAGRAALDAHLFGRHAARPPPLRPLYGMAANAMRARMAGERRPVTSLLVPLDHPG